MQAVLNPNSHSNSEANNLSTVPLPMLPQLQVHFVVPVEFGPQAGVGSLK